MRAERLPLPAKPVPIAPARRNRVALILPGGGMRVAYQAGIVKALHDAGLRFSFADGSSGGTMNLAALLGGASPDQLAARWRTLHASSFASLRPLLAYARFPRTGALGDFDGILGRVFPHLGIDAASVRQARGVQATFNVCDFDDKIVLPVPHGEISTELLLAAISLPLFTPPVRFQGKTWTDAVWIRDANLMETVRAGADELWIAWCIGNTPRFEDGLLEQYVHMIEMAAIGTLNEELAEIAQINERITDGETVLGHSRPIAVHLIKPETPLPLDPDYVMGKIDSATLIGYGYRDAIRYLDQPRPHGVPLTADATKMRVQGRGVHFRDVMTGRIALGETDPVSGARSDAAMPVALHAVIDIDDLGAFITDPDHLDGLSGHVEWHRRGGWLPVMNGRFGLFTPAADDPRLSYMIYGAAVKIAGKDHWLNGRKHVRTGRPWRLWKETTTLYVTLHEGRSGDGPVVGAGVLSLGPSALLSLLRTFRATGCSGPWLRVKNAVQFFGFFASALVHHYLLGRRD